MLWKRRIEIARIIGRHGLGVAIGRSGLGRLVPFHHGALHHQPRDEPYERHEHLRMLFEDLGATYIKLGQILSARPDLLAERYRAELAHLQDAAPPDPPAAMLALVAGELGRDVSEVFAWIDPEPIASASIGEAFRAELADGRDVVVKIRRIGVVEHIELDLAILTTLAQHLDRWWPSARRLGLAGLAEEFATTLRSELDYEVEAANAERIAFNLAAVPNVRLPTIHHHATTSQILTLDFVHGGRVDDPEVLRRAGVSGAEMAARLVGLVLHMVVVDGFFHADPHPGNILVDDDGTIALIDFGMVGALTPELGAHLATLLGAMVTRDLDTICRCFAGLGIAPAAEPVDALRDDLAVLLERYAGRPLGEIGFGSMLHDHLEVARRHGLRLPTELALLAKVLVMSEGLAARLDPDFDALDAFNRWISSNRSSTSKGASAGTS
jgi:ubiquinone biosynthesis protein